VTIPHFDEFIAIDWSGAAGRYDGIAVARCRPGRRAPSLVKPPGRNWTRTAIADWLEHQLTRTRPLLIGLDFAFGFPFERDLGYLGGRAPAVDDVFALWSLIESSSVDDPDFGCAGFVNNPNYECLFWRSGTKPASWVERKRRTEHACAEATNTRPDTLYKLLHSKQVGKASITGIRVLHRIRSRSNAVAIWPFEMIRSSAIVEIYPTMFRKMATGSVAKLRNLKDLNEALDRLGSRPIANAGARDLSDHDTDALISAVGLRAIAPRAETWTFSERTAPLVQREGWIFGVSQKSATPH